MPTKIVTIAGARPQFIKAAPVSRAFKQYPELNEILVHTGQHYDPGLSQVFFSELDLPEPQHWLDVGSGGHGEQTGEMLKRCESVLLEEKPEFVLVYGDTNSTLAGALAAAKLHIPIAHVEAGLRSFNRRMPEEINRIMADHLSSVLFCPTRTSVANLAREGIEQNVYLVGDVMYDAAIQFRSKCETVSSVLSDYGLVRRGFALVTLHRAENTDDTDRLARVLRALEALAGRMPVILPLHPRTRKMIRQFGLQDVIPSVRCLEPLGFLDMMMLVANARVILTDSGGLQKEAYFHRVPCLTLRSETEWTETVTAHWNMLVSTESLLELEAGIEAGLAYKGPREEITEYGNGDAAVRIAEVILNQTGA